MMPNVLKYGCPILEIILLVELDALLLWIEGCTDEIDVEWALTAYPGCTDTLPPLSEVSRQL